MLHPHTELRGLNDHIGLGIFATKPIPRGTIVWTLDALDQKFDARRRRELDADYGPILNRYAYVNAKGESILCWDLARFINHHCEATCLAPGLDFEIAVRDIAAGDQITDDYGSLNLEEPFECGCGSPACRGTILPTDFEVLAPHWNEQIRAAFPDLGRVEQPLWRWVRHKKEIAAGLEHAGRIPSILGHRRAAAPVVEMRGRVRR